MIKRNLDWDIVIVVEVVYIFYNVYRYYFCSLNDCLNVLLLEVFFDFKVVIKSLSVRMKFIVTIIKIIVLFMIIEIFNDLNVLFFFSIVMDVSNYNVEINIFFVFLRCFWWR